MVKRAPICAGFPLVFGLAGCNVVGDFDFIKASTTGHGVLVREQMAPCTQFSGKASQPQKTRKGKATAIRETLEMDADCRRGIGVEGIWVRVGGQVEEAVPGSVRGKARVGYNDGHLLSFWSVARG